MGRLIGVVGTEQGEGGREGNDARDTAQEALGRLSATEETGEFFFFYKNPPTPNPHLKRLRRYGWL